MLNLCTTFCPYSSLVAINKMRRPEGWIALIKIIFIILIGESLKAVDFFGLDREGFDYMLLKFLTLSLISK